MPSRMLVSGNAGLHHLYAPEYQSLEDDGQHDTPIAMDDTVRDRTCRLVVRFATNGGHHLPASVSNTVMPLYTGDGGSKIMTTFASVVSMLMLR